MNVDGWSEERSPLHSKNTGVHDSVYNIHTLVWCTV